MKINRQQLGPKENSSPSPRTEGSFEHAGVNVDSLRAATRGSLIQAQSPLSPVNLLELIDTTEDDPSINPEIVAQARLEIRDTFEVMPTILDQFTRAYRQAFEALGVDVGKINIYLVGGRARKQALKDSSDIDLVIAVENPPYSHSDQSRQKIGLNNWMEIRRKLVFEALPKICEDQGIARNNGYAGRFQILSWGENTPKEAEAKANEHGAWVLLHQA